MTNHVTREAELFGILVDLLADKKLERNALRVLVGTRGFELGRPYMHLCQQGLIAEETVRPGFLRRLFGARETQWVRITEHGLKIAAEALAEDDGVGDGALDGAEARDWDSAGAPPAPLEAPVAQQHLPEPEPVLGPEPEVALEAVPEPVVVPEAVAVPELVPEPPVPVPPVPEPPVSEPVAASEPVVEPVAPQPEPVAIEKPAPRAKAVPPRRFAPTDFTDTLGGVPVESAFQTPSSDRLDDLAENLGLLGFEVTEAGKLLAVSRWAQGSSDAEVALEVITTALAHAARLSASGTAALDPELALALARRVRENFAIFVTEGLLAADSLTLWADRMVAFLSESADSSGLEDYLLDPWRGIAPPAVCPDEIYLPSEVEED